MMSQANDEQLIQILLEEAKPALGCTEPVACALACAKCKEILEKMPEQVDVYVSGNIFKNGMGVGIPGTGMTGLPIAAALGVVCGDSKLGLEVLKHVSEGDNLERAKNMLTEKRIAIHLKEDVTDKLYAEAVCKAGEDTARVVIVHGHTNIVRIEKNHQILLDNPCTGKSSSKCKQRPELSINRIWEFVNTIDTSKIEFLLRGVEMNKTISNEGLKSAYGLCIGKTLKENVDRGLLCNDFLNKALMCATAASDARMDGCEKPVMTNSGSGNQGITVILPVVVAAEQFQASQDKLLRALALSNLVAAHIHSYMGHLSALCGILIASTGASSAITYLMGGSKEQVENTIKTMLSNLTGMICDGAKQGCALKVYSGVSAAVQAALLSINNVKTHNDGIIDPDIETTIKNIGILSGKGMEQTDKTILSIMCNKNK